MARQFPPEWYAHQAQRRKNVKKALKSTPHKGDSEGTPFITRSSFSKDKTRTWKQRVTRHQKKTKVFTGASGTQSFIDSLYSTKGHQQDANELSQDMRHLKSIQTEKWRRPRFRGGE